MLPSVLQPNETDHVPVLAEEVRRLLAVRPGETVVDATFGAGGHATLLAHELRGSGKLIAIDRDPSAKPYFERFRRRAGVSTRFLRGDFSVVLRQLADNGVRADAVLLDLGVSSMQIDRPERGFSYATDAPLDMRMDPTADLSARELVNDASERDLERIFRRYGEERFARQIARAIGRRRREHPYERTGELVDTIKHAIPAPARFGEGHPAKRVFQALRIAVNDELGALEQALPAATAMLRPGGRLAVICSTRSRIGSSSASCATRSAAAPARPISRCACAGASRRCARSGAGPCGRRPRRSPTTRVPRPRACAPRRRRSDGGLDARGTGRGPGDHAAQAAAAPCLCARRGGGSLAASSGSRCSPSSSSASSRSTSPCSG